MEESYLYIHVHVYVIQLTYIFLLNLQTLPANQLLPIRCRFPVLHQMQIKHGVTRQNQSNSKTHQANMTEI